MKRSFSFLLLCSFATLVFYACTKNVLPVPYTYVSGQQASLKINYASAYRANPAVQLKVNDERVSTVISYPFPYPGGGLNTNGNSTPDYFAVNAGSNKITIAIPKAGTNIDSVVLYTTTVSVEAGKYFTAHIADTTANTQTVLVPEDVASPDSGFSKYRFVNLLPDQTAVDLYFGTTKLASAIPYKGASPYFTIISTTAAQWAIRPAGALATTTALTTYPTGTTVNTVPNQRVFTVFARGYSSISASTDPRRVQISLFYNR